MGQRPNIGSVPSRRRAPFVVGLGLLCGCGPLDLASVGHELGVADCPADTNVILGSSGDDVLTGTLGADCIVGFGGDDVLVGDAGDDFLIGGLGADTLEGGGDSDMLYGEDGEDVLRGGAGADQLFGGPGSDVLLGDAGTDSGAGDAENDVLASTIEQPDGGAGTDSCAAATCEGGPYVTCTADEDCSSGSRCLRETACVSCAGDTSPSCTGILAVGVVIDEVCPAGFLDDGQGNCVEIVP